MEYKKAPLGGGGLTATDPVSESKSSILDDLVRSAGADLKQKVTIFSELIDACKQSLAGFRQDKKLYPHLRFANPRLRTTNRADRIRSLTAARIDLAEKLTEDLPAVTKLLMELSMVEAELVAAQQLHDEKIEEGKRFEATGLYLHTRKGDARKAAERTVSGLWDLIGRLVDFFQPDECANYFSSCGYEPE